MMMIMMMMMMTQFLPITTVTEIHTFILGSEFKYGAQVPIHALGFINSTCILLKCDAYTCHKYETTVQNKYNASPNLMVLSVAAEIEIKVKRNMKSSRNKSDTTFPQI